MRKQILDIPIDWVSQEEVITLISDFITSRKPHQITTVNPEFIVESRINPEFKAVLQVADLSLADGVGIQIAQIYNHNLTSANISWTILKTIRFYKLVITYPWLSKQGPYHRISGVDLCEEIIKQANQSGWKIYLLGANPGVAQKTAEIWQNRYPRLQVSGTSSANPNDPNIVPSIRATKPDILLVAYGAPKQELFIASHKKELNVPVMIGVGGTFDYVAGNMFRAPKMVRQVGLEWFVRLLFQPKRVGRIFNAIIKFPRLVIQN